MSIRDCECGGKRLIVDTSILKVTGDKKIRLRCNVCKRLVSAYQTPEGTTLGSRANGRPMKQL